MNKIVKLLTLNIEYTDSVLYRRVLLISSTSILTTFIFIFFTFLNAFYLNNYTIALFDLAASVVSFMVIFNLKRYKNIPFAAKLATSNFIIFLLLLAYINGNSHFSLIWTIFLPIFAIFTNGKKIGLYFSVLFYLVLLSMAYANIGIWVNGEWLIQDWIRLTFVSVVLTLWMYMNEKAIEESNNALAVVRKLDKDRIEEMHEKAITDQLTGLYNRRHYNEMVPQLMNIAKRKNYYITFFIVDIDYFKNYNDFYGHMQGDDTLIRIANTIKKYVQRGDDFVFRLGGEEFAGIILSDDYEKTHTWIEKLCPIIEELKIQHAQSKISQYVTASIGISTICHDKEYNMDNLYSFADKALYTAKHQGRNRSQLSIKCA